MKMKPIFRSIYLKQWVLYNFNCQRCVKKSLSLCKYFKDWKIHYQHIGSISDVVWFVEFKISYFMFFRRKNVLHFWSDMMVSKWWQNLHFWLKYPIKQLIVLCLSSQCSLIQWYLQSIYLLTNRCYFSSSFEEVLHQTGIKLISGTYGKTYYISHSSSYWMYYSFVLFFSNCLHPFSKLCIFFSQLYTQIQELHTQHAKCLTSLAKWSTAFRISQMHLKIKPLQHLCHNINSC